MKIALLLNADGGTFRTADLDAFSSDALNVMSEAGHHAEVLIKPGAAIEPAIERCVRRDDIDALIVGGGDGTISTAASCAFLSGMPLGVAPGGTMNLFARAMGLPMDPLQAITALAAGKTSHVDIATANGKPFVHQFSVGLHARLVRLRNAQVFGSRLGKIRATITALGSVIADPPRFGVEIDAGNGFERRHVSAVSVGNNRLTFTPVPVSESLDSGILGLYVADAMTPRAVLTLTVDAILGRLTANPDVSDRTAHEIKLRFPRLRRGANAVIDGELIPLEKEVTLQIHPGGLPIIVPAAVKGNAVTNDRNPARMSFGMHEAVLHKEGRIA